jgi:hypothetical protein
MIPNRLLFEMDVLRARWGWLLSLGILMATLGTIALLIVPATTIGTGLVAGWLLVFTGIIEMVHAFRVRLWGGLVLSPYRWSARAPCRSTSRDPSSSRSGCLDTAVRIVS